jgi:hypothetical protein
MEWKQIVEVIGGLAALGTGFWAVWTYHQSAKLERSRWMKELYEKFYEHDELKKTRDLLDGGDSDEISRFVHDEPPAFTDYLNFFEFLGYLYESGQIKLEEIRGMFDYYLKNLREHPAVLNYINAPAKGFEKLRALLKQV